MLELRREDYKLVISNIDRSWFIVDTTSVVSDEDTLVDSYKGMIPGISLVYKIKNHELLSIFMDTCLGTHNGNCYIYVFVIENDIDYSSNRLFPMANCIFNAAYADEVVNYRKGDQMIYRCSEEYLDLQCQVELSGEYDKLPNIVFNYFAAMMEEILSEDFEIITTREEEVKWPEDDVEDEVIEVYKSTNDVCRNGYWLEYIGL